MAYGAHSHLGHNDAIRFFLGELTDSELNALQNDVSWCTPCRSVLEEAWFDLESIALTGISLEPGEDAEMIQEIYESARLDERRRTLD